MSCQGQVVDPCRGNDHAISEVTVERLREVVNRDDCLSVQGHDRQHIGRGRSPQPCRKRNRQIDSAFGVEHLYFPLTYRRQVDAPIFSQAIQRLPLEVRQWRLR
jgi:hypothetical protein